MLDILKTWMTVASKEEVKMLAEEAGTSVAYLRQLSTCFRKPKVEMAAKIECAAAVIREASGDVDRLPIINRGDLCDTCKRCPHYNTTHVYEEGD